MPSPAPSQPLRDETFLPDEGAAEIIDFLSSLKDHGRQAAEPRLRLTGQDGRGVELPRPMFEVLLLEYRRRQRSAAELALADMVADTERLSLYDANPEDVRAALSAARK